MTKWYWLKMLSSIARNIDMSYKVHKHIHLYQVQCTLLPLILPFLLKKLEYIENKRAKCCNIRMHKYKIQTAHEKVNSIRWHCAVQLSMSLDNFYILSIFAFQTKYNALDVLTDSYTDWEWNRSDQVCVACICVKNRVSRLWAQPKTFASTAKRRRKTPEQIFEQT